MSDDEALRQALDAAGYCTELRAARPLSGGCIHRVSRLELADGTAVVAKVNRADQAEAFEAEAQGLAALAATGAVLVPQPLAVGIFGRHAVLLMTALEPGRAGTDDWRGFGAQLAALHAHEAGDRYGLDRDNFLGTTPQPNGWSSDWVEFNAERRLGHQVRLARDHRRLEDSALRRLQRVIDRLGDLLPCRPRPSLLHGDLWSGNALPTAGGRVAMLDPACSVGDGWADIAMMRLFGGFPPECFEAYGAAVPDHENLEIRVHVYQLYHVLNHVNLFGAGYVAQAMDLAARVGA